MLVSVTVLLLVLLVSVTGCVGVCYWYCYCAVTGTVGVCYW